ncbi:D-alanyl-D-alanine carboxypeptidase precursor [bacterium BMS3Bbin04]|nr:D-alanyl-D-alanine carboxypeptidase precursor [bacterium BMS3Bbin04]
MPIPLPAADGVSIVHYSAPLDSLLIPMMKVSSNAWAEQIAAGTGSYKWGAYLPTWPSVLDSLGLPPDEGMRAADACGMSRRNRMRAETVHHLLVAANATWGERWLNLLPMANEEGSTLEGRFKGLEDRIIAKTGSLSGCRSLAGYILDKHGDPALDFVIFVNHAPSSPTSTIDEYVRNLVTQLDRDPKE